MINIIASLLETPEEINFIENKEPLMEEMYNELYKTSVENINNSFKKSNDIIKENIFQIRDFLRYDYNRENENQKFRFHSLVANPSIPEFDKTILTNYVNDAKKYDGEINSYMISKQICPICDVKTYAMKLLGTPVESNLTSKAGKQLAIEISFRISKIKDDLEDIKNILIGQLSECNNEYLFKLVLRTSNTILSNELAKVYAYMRAFLEIFQSFTITNSIPITESAGNDEDVFKYIKELRELIPKCREYFDKFKYKEIITPRKKTINKMDEYMRGALERKYTLKIPIYKVENASPDAKKIIENDFIAGLKRIVDKYPNYILMTPDFKDDTDMFIYITLKEPFGNKQDRSNRVQQSRNDGAVISESSNYQNDIITENANILALLGLTGTMGAVTIWGLIKMCKNIKEQYKLSKEIKKNNKDEDPDKKFKLQKRKLTLVKEFNFKYIKNLKKAITESKFVKCKKGTIEASEKLVKLGIEYINYVKNNIPKDDYLQKEEFIEFLKTQSIYENKIKDILNLIEDEWVDVDNKNLLGSNFQSLYDNYEEMYKTLNDYYDFDHDIYYDIFSADYLYDAWAKISNSIKIQIDGDSLNESTSHWENKDYELINTKIEAMRRRIENIGSMNDSYIAKHGYENKGLMAKHEELNDELGKLFEERNAIAKSMMNESVFIETPLTSNERNSLPDEIFGLPGRRYPLNDITHIRLAISRMDPCDVSEKIELANNISKQVCKQKLVGKVTVSEINPNSKYFPKWMTCKSTLSNGYIYCGDDKYKVKDILEESSTGSTLEFYI